MNYLRKQIDETDEAAARINLSQKEDVRTAALDTPASKMRVLPTPQCDWCADGVPLYVYASSRTSTGEFRQCWRWMACAKCNRDIENGNWSALERRVRARFKQFFGAKLAEIGKDRPVPESLIDEAVRASLSEFHLYVITCKPVSGREAR
jgi:hypothetical protein